MKYAITVTCLLFAAVQPATAASPTAVPVDGEPFSTRLVAADADWDLTFREGQEDRTLPAADLVRWGTCRDITRGPVLVLPDGGRLVADVYQADKETLAADVALFGTAKLPLESLAGVVFQLPQRSHKRDLLLDRIARATGTSDRLLLVNGDEVTGLIESLEDDTIKLTTDVGTLEIETERIAAVIFNPALRRSSTPRGLRAWVGLADGSRLLATQLVLNENLATITAAGRDWKCLADDVVFLQPLGGRATYLSDLKAAGYRHVPYLDLAWPYRTDRNVTAGQLRCNGQLYLKGLGLHSAARLTYALDGAYERFDTALGIDDSTAGRGSITARVYVDGRPQFSSDTVRGGDAPVPISVDVTDAKRLDLIVDFADRADEQDHADWLDARLVKKPE